MLADIIFSVKIILFIAFSADELRIVFCAAQHASRVDETQIYLGGSIIPCLAKLAFVRIVSVFQAVFHAAVELAVPVFV